MLKSRSRAKPRRVIKKTSNVQKKVGHEVIATKETVNSNDKLILSIKFKFKTDEIVIYNI